MSGGRFQYVNDQLANDIFGWGMNPDYGNDGFSQSRLARYIDPMEDKMLSEMLWDMFCLLHSLDWYQSGDTGEDTYLKDVEYFKGKWLKPTAEELVQHQIEESIADLRKELAKSLCFGQKSDNFLGGKVP